MNPVYLGEPALVSALGSGLSEHLDKLLDPPQTSPLTFDSSRIPGKTRALGAVSRPLRPMPADLPTEHLSRNNRLLWDALEQIEPQIHAAVERYGADRVAVVIGTSTSGVDENIPFFRHIAQGGAPGGFPFRQQQPTLSAAADFVRYVYRLDNMAYGVSTACTSGARALVGAARLLDMGLCDAVICGGTDTLSLLTVNGFSALEVLSEGIANPFSANRDGINIGEAAAVFVATREPNGRPALLGYGNSSDAYHMSTPRPDAAGAAAAFQAALKSAALSAADIGWINLHGTGTVHNDSMESRAVSQIFGNSTPATSTKPLTGHTLGAAGALEAAFLWAVACREHNPEGRLPPHLWDGAADPALPHIALTGTHSCWPHGRRIGASSSFAFGGNNSVLLIGETN